MSSSSPSSPDPASLSRRLIPTPNIQTNLRPRRNRECSVPSLGVSLTIRPQVLPEDSIPLDRFEGDPLLGSVCLFTLLALQKPTPLRARRHLQAREVCPAACAVCIQIHHECAETVTAASPRSAPIIVVPVVTRGIVALCPHPLDVEVWAPALECTNTLFNAAYCVVAVEQGAVGEADCGVDPFGDAVGYDGRAVFVDAAKKTQSGSS